MVWEITLCMLTCVVWQSSVSWSVSESLFPIAGQIYPTCHSHIQPNNSFKSRHSCLFCVQIDWPGEEELVEEKWEDVEKWITDEFCTESPWVLKGILAYQEVREPAGVF